MKPLSKEDEPKELYTKCGRNEPTKTYLEHKTRNAWMKKETAIGLENVNALYGTRYESRVQYELGNKGKDANGGNEMSHS